ncbi:helix-turn-helix domain-containing protein [Paenibacillus silvae]|uniref:helix-turn-helix domain-containing protein n=1 Tax=Paenibacillus silvae TaxID=1325358 RepID=UPI0011A18360|nr:MULTISPECIES: helix-turn-helix domain-containing protein [Paenibacillus]MCK6077716.1 helix-turn-helix domain-containing protein [Paenibacillus silvae]MCK6151915.1 helix-turn-helix domain-containing protein [Paenibacillus silvae]MCK6270600.1 helix-turn-helix domain-containing protein [Paenibacillus silvae]
MSNNWFRRLLLSYLPIFFIVTTILFFIFFQIFNEQNRREALKANEFLASQVTQYLDNSLRSIDFKVLREILTNSNLKNYFSVSGSEDVYAGIQAVKVIDELKIEYPLIDSVYLVRYSDNTVFSNGKAMPIHDFPDATFIEDSRSRDEQKWVGARSFKAFPSQTAEQVITIVRNAANGRGLVVANVELNTLRKSIMQMYDPEFTFVNIYNRAGGSLWNNGMPEDHIMSGPTLASKTAAASGEVFSEFTSSYSGWKVQTGLNNGKIVKFALQFYNIWFIFAAGVVLVGVAWVVYVTRRNYKPIQQIVTLIQTVSSQKPSALNYGKENEFRFIHTTLERMIDQTRQYQEEHEENLILQKKVFFQELLEGTRDYSGHELSANMSRFKLPELEHRWAVLVVEMDRYDVFEAEYHQQDQALLKFVLSSILQESARHEGTDVWAEWVSEQRLYAILWLPETEHSEEMEARLLTDYLDRIGQYLNFTVTIGVGRVAVDLRGLRASLKEAVHALEYKAVLGTNRIIPCSDVPNSTNDVYEFLKTISLLVQAMRLSDEVWEQHFERLFKQIRQSVLSRQEIMNTVQLLFQHYNREFAELPQEYKETWAAIFTPLLPRLEGWETLDDLRELCLEGFRELARQMQSLQCSRKHRSHILEIRKYIEEHYTNPDLSLNYLSDLFDINPKYLSKLFKDELGEKFVDLLISHRIEKAKQLMQETDKAIQEISEEVGYTNYNSFNRAFKNVVGMAPSDYRKAM